jgi:hypothetical protein
MGFGLVSCWLSRSGLILTVYAPTFINSEFTNPIFHPATETARTKPHTNQSRSVVSARPKRVSGFGGPLMIHRGLKIKHVVVHFEPRNSADQN